MRNIRLALWFLFIMIIAHSSVNALSCSNSDVKDLYTAASYVKAAYEVFDNSTIKEFTYGDSTKSIIMPNFTFEITIYNISEELFVKIKDNVTESYITIEHSDTNDGNYVFTNDDFGCIYKYTVDIYSAKEGCYGEKIKTITFVKPKYNAYSQYTFCENSSNYYCQKFAEKELNIKDDDDFLNKIKVNNSSNKPEETQEETEEEDAYDIISKKPILYIGVLCGVIIVSTVVIIVVRRKQKNKEWKL